MKGNYYTTAVVELGHFPLTFAFVVDIVASGKAAAGVLIRPVTVAEIQRTADEGLLMPPKSTFFTPKLRTGPVIRPLH